MKVRRTTVITAAGGLLVAFVLFMLTAPSFTYLGPVGRPDRTDFVEDFGGSDPWTGELRPRTWTYTDTTDERVTQVFDLGPEYRNYRAVPLPVGFAAGCIVTLTVITIAARRPRRTPSSPAVSGA